MDKREILAKMSKCHDEIKSHPFRWEFEKRYIGDYKFLLYHLTEIWCDLIWRLEELQECEKNQLRQFGNWIHDYRQHLQTWNNTCFPMHLFDYYEQMLQVTHNFINNGDLTVYYNLDCYFTDKGRQIKSTKYVWITEEDCNIASEILPRYFPVNAPFIIDDDKVKEYFLNDYFIKEAEKKEANFKYWLKNTKPVLEWINEQRKTIDSKLPIWHSAVITPSKNKRSDNNAT